MKVIRVLVASIVTLTIVGCQERYRCVGHEDQLIENKSGETGPTCETPDGRFYNAVQD